MSDHPNLTTEELLELVWEPVHEELLEQWRWGVLRYVVIEIKDGPHKGFWGLSFRTSTTGEQHQVRDGEVTCKDLRRVKLTTVTKEVWSEVKA